MKVPKNTAVILTVLGVVILFPTACAKSVKILDDEENESSGAKSTSNPADIATPVKCGLNTCTMNESCCFTTGECYDPNTSVCALVPDGGVDDQAVDGSGDEISDNTDDNTGSKTSDGQDPIVVQEFDEDACASNVDCTPDEFCFADLCLGPGRCVSRTEHPCNRRPDHSGMLDGSEMEKYNDHPDFLAYVEQLSNTCACDGRDYPSECSAYSQGVRVSQVTAMEPCGGYPENPSMTVNGKEMALPRIMSTEPLDRQGCGPSATCGVNKFCCHVTWTCMPKEEQERCIIPPGDGYPCTAQFSNCHAEEYEEEFCYRPGCGDKGYCVLVEADPYEQDCSILEPVCGCDNVTYLNACLAEYQSMSIAHKGECDDSVAEN